GNYTIDQLNAGDAYKVVADCGGSGKFSSVETSDMQAPAAKTPSLVSPLSSLIAAKVMQAIFDSITTTLNGMSGVSDSVKATVKSSLVTNLLPALASQLKTTIESAVASGSMQEPSATEATNLSTSVAAATEASATDLQTATTSYETTKPTPPAVDQTLAGVKSDAGAFVACNASYGGTEATCTKALAKLLFNGLGFPIILKTSGGVFGTFTCADTDATLAADLNNFVAATSVEGHNLTGACYISSKIQRLDRNARADDNHKGGPVFSESFDMNGDSSVDVGYITALGSAMFNGYSYKLSDLDKLLFGFDATSKAGLNARLLQMRYRTDGPPSLAYLSGSTWTLANHPALASGPWPLFQCLQTDTAGVYSAKNQTFNFWLQNGGDCATALSGATGSNGNCSANCSTFSTIISSINSNNFTTAGVFEKSFGGPIPTESQIQDQFENGRTHLDYNPSGQPYMWVLWDQFPVWEKKVCSNVNDPTTCVTTRPCDTYSGTFDPAQCVGSDGLPHTVRVNLTFGSAVADGKFKGFKPVTQMTKSDTGRYYLSPIWDSNGFSGLFNIIDSQTGTYVRDEFFNYRAIKVIVKAVTTSECDATAHGTMTGCTRGNIYNASMQWGNGGVTYSVPAPAAISYVDANNSTVSFSFSSDVKVQWQQCQPGSPCSPGKVAFGDWSNMTPIKFTPTAASNAITGLAADANGAYYLTPLMNCVSNVCSQNGFYLMDSAGLPYGYGASQTFCDPNGTNGGTNCASINYCSLDVNNNMSCQSKNVYKLTETAISGFLGTSDLDPGTGVATWSDNVVNYQIPNAPAANPVFRCSAEPWFIDGNGDGVLNCNANDTAASGTDKTFSYDGDAQRYIASQANPGSIRLLPNQNGYAFGDPVGAKTLVTTAFKGWLDGAHSLSSTTTLNALQGLALVFLYFEEGGGGSGGRHICSNGSAPVCLDPSNPNATYQTTTPIFEGGGPTNNPLLDMNKAFGASLSTFKQ
ncbi:MAG: hypothetical protein ACXVCP_18895, partial [Bdellovibrio sp.]